MKGLLRLLVPGGVVLLAAAVAIRVVDDATLALVTGRYGIVLYGVGALLAAVFHRSRVVTALLGFACVGLVGVAAEGAPDPFVPFATLLMALLGLLSLLRDRGVGSRAGAAQLGEVAVLTALTWFGVRDPEWVAAFTDARLLPVGIPWVPSLPDWTVVVGSGSLALTGLGAWRWRGPVERALFLSVAALAVAVLPAIGDAAAHLLLMATGLVLAISVLETSYVMAYRDELTGLPARRALMRELEQISGTYTVAMVDVDHFKQFNDKYGHDVGDQVLQLVAARLADGPGGGKAYRYGGEEFTLLYPGRARDAALPHAEAVRRSVEIATFSLRAWNRPRKKPSAGRKPKKPIKRPRKLSVTVSVGLADSSRLGDPTAVLKRADEALYEAKRGGRNRVAQ
jgi:diguanylate cyclase (GGDEF)-like protein